MERCEKIPPETYESGNHNDGNRPPLYLPRLDRDGKVLGDSDYSVPSPPERDMSLSKPQLTQADLEEYARTYQDPHFTQVLYCFILPILVLFYRFQFYVPIEFRSKFQLGEYNFNQR